MKLPHCARHWSYQIHCKSLNPYTYPTSFTIKCPITTSTLVSYCEFVQQWGWANRVGCIYDSAPVHWSLIDAHMQHCSIHLLVLITYQFSLQVSRFPKCVMTLSCFNRRAALEFENHFIYILKTCTISASLISNKLFLWISSYSPICSFLPFSLYRAYHYMLIVPRSPSFPYRVAPHITHLLRSPPSTYRTAIITLNSPYRAYNPLLTVLHSPPFTHRSALTTLYSLYLAN